MGGKVYDTSALKVLRPSAKTQGKVSDKGVDCISNGSVCPGKATRVLTYTFAFKHLVGEG